MDKSLTGAFTLGLPKWVEESDDPYIMRLKEQSYMPGVGYVREFFNEMLVAGSCRGTNMGDAMFAEQKAREDEDFQRMIYGDDEELLASAMNAYLKHYRNGVVSRNGVLANPEAALHTAPDVELVTKSVMWRPAPEDIEAAVEEAELLAIHEDILTDDSARTDDFGQEAAHVDSEIDGIGELMQWSGVDNLAIVDAMAFMDVVRNWEAIGVDFGNQIAEINDRIKWLSTKYRPVTQITKDISRRAPLTDVLAVIEARWDGYTNKQRKFITRLINQTVTFERMEMRRNAKGVMVECPVRVRRINSLAEMAGGATLEWLVEQAVDQHAELLARYDEEAHPEAERNARMHIALDNQDRILAWTVKASKPQAATETQPAKNGKSWLAHPAYQVVLGYALNGGGARTPKVAHNRAYAADTLRLPDRILGYDSTQGFLVMLNKSQSQTGLVPVADARVVYPHLPASAKARMKQLSTSQAVAPLAQ